MAIAGTVLIVRRARDGSFGSSRLMLLGSALWIVFEPVLDAVGGVGYATVNQHLGLPRIWGVNVDLHMLFAYYIFLGLTAVAIARYVRGGAGQR